MSYFVTRQHRWPDGACVVEVTSGGRDGISSDALCAKYPGEWEEYADPREAVQVGLKIACAWAEVEDSVEFAWGTTLGGLCGLESAEVTAEVAQEAWDWASEVWEATPKCDQCGGVLGKQRWGLYDFDDLQFCSEQCAERFWQENMEDGDDEE